MQGTYIIVGLIVAAIVLLFEWKQLQAQQRKEKVWITVFTVSAVIMYSILIFNRDLPGPTEGVSSLLEPVALWLGLD